MLGFIWVGIGAVGAFVPLLPTTIFIILALGCFARSSPRLEHWLLNHERFGPALRAWRDKRAISKSAKRAAYIGMTVGYGLFCVSVRPRPLLADRKSVVEGQRVSVSCDTGGCRLIKKK